MKEFETIFCTTLMHLDEKSLIFLSPKFPASLTTTGPSAGGFGESVCVLLKDTHTCWPPLYFNTDVLPTLKGLAEPQNEPTPSTPSLSLLEKNKLSVWSLLPKFSIIRNKMNCWLEHIHCYHDKQCFAFRHKARMPLRLLSCIIMLEVLTNAIRQANQKYKQ